ncbi:PAS domain-containing protein [Streptomyces inhibens]|uniref:PAS domain-containing protein n=1 Tax=Streptomyces inhibens TaxID=2293571 RepID=UPI0036A4BE38
MMTSENDLPEGSGHVCDIAKAATAELDARGRIIAWTRAAERLLGYPAEEVLNRPAADLLALPGDRARAAGGGPGGGGG